MNRRMPLCGSQYFTKIDVPYCYTHRKRRLSALQIPVWVLGTLGYGYLDVNIMVVSTMVVPEQSGII